MPTRTFLNLSKDKQERIMKAAIEEFSKRNLDDANLSNIISAAGISRGSWYQYFTSKGDLYVHLFETLRNMRADFVKPAYGLYKKEPFLDFFKAFYLLDSEYLLRRPQHIELGKHLYTCDNNISRGLIQRLQTKYRETFLIAIEFDKDRGLIRRDIDSIVLAELCVHFVTDVFIFQSIATHLSLNNLQENMEGMLHIISTGIAAS